ncbi:hypothetical protein 16Q_154 [Pseudomonas phage 16Q]|nr:hypothetical protein 16Q_154 [Pseudomonas phage 16Q]
MILATILTVCTLSCSNYVVDAATTAQDAAINKAMISLEIKRVWNDTSALEQLFLKYGVEERAADAQIWELNTVTIEESQIP